MQLNLEWLKHILRNGLAPQNLWQKNKSKRKNREMEDILKEIIREKAKEVVRHKDEISLYEMKDLALKQDQGLSFLEALIPLTTSPINIIAECKKASPSKGLIQENYDPVTLAKSYERGGAAAISVLTDTPFFMGSLQDLKNVSEAVNIPVMRKDFIIDEYQIWQAKHYGASSFLLLAGTLDRSELQYFIEIGREVAMEPLVECHTEEDLDIALSTDAKIIGINNRNLSTFAVNHEHSKNLYQKIEKNGRGRIAVCESGIKNRNDVENLAQTGYKSFLIGEALVRASAPEDFLRELRTRVN
jgi:indole-3-glycerol phosphate synthase